MDWTVEFDGLVQQACSVQYGECLQWRSIEKSVTVVEANCSPHNLRIDHAVWSGVLFSDLMERVGVSSAATYAQCEAADGYSTFLRLDQLKCALLAYSRNGETLTDEQGYPMRLIVPGVYGYKMPKSIRHIHFTDRPLNGTKENQGWSSDGQVQTVAYIQSPHQRAVVSDAVEFSGIAFAGVREIVRIEVSVDGAPWTPAPFTPGSPGSWTPWQVSWTPPTPGDYQVKVRATDSQGFTQADIPSASPFPNGWNAIHSIVVRVAG